MTNVPLSQINIDSDLPLGGTKKITDARQIGLKENDTIGAKTAVIEINSAGQVVIGDGTNPVVPFFSVVTGTVISGALPVGNEVLSTVVAPTVTNTFLKAVVAGPNISFVWEAVSGGSFALSGDPNPTLAGDMVTGANKIKKGTAGTDAYVKMGTSLIEVGTGAGVSYTIPTTAVAHKPVKMNSAGDAFEFANIRAADVGLAATYSGNLAASAPTTVEALGTAVDGLVLGTPTFHMKEEFVTTTSYMAAAHTGIEQVSIGGGGWLFSHRSASSLIGSVDSSTGSGSEFGLVRLQSSAGVNSSSIHKDAIFYTGQDFTMRVKARVQSGALWVGLIANGVNAAAVGVVFPEPPGGTTPIIALAGGNSGGNTTWNWVYGNGVSGSSTTTGSVAQATFVDVIISSTSGTLTANVIGGSGNYAPITTLIPNNVWLTVGATVSNGSDAYIDKFHLTIN